MSDKKTINIEKPEQVKEEPFDILNMTGEVPEPEMKAF